MTTANKREWRERRLADALQQLAALQHQLAEGRTHEATGAAELGEMAAEVLSLALPYPQANPTLTLPYPQPYP